MAEDTQKHTPYGSDGSGLYSLATRGCYDVMRNAKNDVLAASERALAAYQRRGDKGAFVVADYGTADGGTSMPLMAEVLKVLRERAGPELPLLVVYEDQVSSTLLARASCLVVLNTQCARLSLSVSVCVCILRVQLQETDESVQRW